MTTHSSPDIVYDVPTKWLIERLRALARERVADPKTPWIGERDPKQHICWTAADRILNVAQTVSVPVLTASHNSGEGDPAVTLDCAGADTVPQTSREPFRATAERIVKAEQEKCHGVIHGCIRNIREGDIRQATIEECAKLIESGAGMADLIDQDDLDQQAKYIRALSLSRPHHSPTTNQEK